jgi:hypothetical protein
MRLSVTGITNSILFIVYSGFFFFLSGCHGRSEIVKIKTREVQIKKLLVFNDLKPKIKSNFYSEVGRNFDIDEKGNYYILDSDKNSVFVFSPDGKYIRQIGSLGKDKEGLFNTLGLRIRNNKLYINNELGRQIKVFSLEGKYLSHIQFGKSVINGNWIDVDENIFYTIIKAAYQRYNELKLFHLYKEGTGHYKQFGRLIECNNITGYQFFNACMFSIRNGNIVGAHLSVPIVYRYSLNGEELFYIDLRKLGLSEVNSKVKFAVASGCDQPEKIASKKKKVTMVRYCSGFDVAHNLHSYYSIITHDFPPCIYHFDENGLVLERIVLKHGDDILTTKSIIIAEKSNIKYGIGFISTEYDDKKGKILLFSF